MTRSGSTLRRGFRGRLRLAILVASGALAAGCGGGGAPPVSGQPDVLDYAGAGPYTTTVELVSDCTIFRPGSFGPEGLLHPVVLWGNGTGSAPPTYRVLLTHLASHGFIVAAANSPNAGDGSQMLACLAAVVDQGASVGSALFRRVDVDRVGASGHSQGGAGAIMAGRDARVGTVASLQPYIQPISGGGKFATDSIGQQQGAMLLLSGGADRIAAPEANQRPVFDGANTPVVWATLLAAGHDVTSGAGVGFHAPITAWFRASLMGDPRAAWLFPPNCRLCDTFGWDVVSR